MKQILFISALLFSLSFQINAQTYMPMNLDTTCFWVNSYNIYFSGTICDGNITSYIEKDTVINSIQYFKLNSYRSNVNTGDSCMLYLNSIYNPLFIRDDTATKKIMAYYYFNGISSEYILVDFDKQIGDSIYDCGYKYPIDSISIDTISSIPRRVQWYHVWLNHSTIEGIGRSKNSFPLCGFGEWGMPFSTLQYYCKNGQQLYPNNNIGTCIRPAPLAVANSFINDFEFSFFDNNLKLQHLDESTQLDIFNTVGQKLYEENIHSTYYQRNLSNMLASGMYIVLIQNKKNRQVYKVEIQ